MAIELERHTGQPLVGVLGSHRRGSDVFIVICLGWGFGAEWSLAVGHF